MNWDVLVLDNARYHDGGENKYLTDWLWDDFRILLLFFAHPHAQVESRGERLGYAGQASQNFPLVSYQKCTG